jgi:hypothetical protein
VGCGSPRRKVIEANYGLTAALLSLMSSTSIFAPRLNRDTTSRSFTSRSRALRESKFSRTAVTYFKIT